MKRIFLLSFISLSSLVHFSSAQIPNNDFENWTPSPVSSEVLDNWNSLYSKFLAAMIYKDSDAFSGTYSLHMYNGVFPSFASASFPVLQKPGSLLAYVKGTVEAGDSIIIRVVLYYQLQPVDSGRWAGYSGFNSFTQVTVPISQFSAQSDSAFIYISGGTHLNTDIKYDLLTFDYSSYVPEDAGVTAVSVLPLQNPFSNVLRLEILSPRDFFCSLFVFDSKGTEVEERKDLWLVKGSNQVCINSSSYSTGNYLCVLQNEKFVATLQVVKVR